MKYTFDSLNVYFRYYKSALQLNLDSTIFDFDFDFWQNTVAKQAPFYNTLLHGREKVKIGAVFVKCVVFNTSCVANFPSVVWLQNQVQPISL